MPIQNKSYLLILEKLILFFFTLQLVAVNFSIAATSIGFGVSSGLWVIYMFLKRDFHIEKTIRKDIKIVLFLVLLFLVFDVISKIFAIFPEGNFWGIKRTFLFLNFFIAITVIKSFKELIYLLLAVVLVTSLISVYEVIYYFATLSEELKSTEWGLIRINYFSYPLTEGQIKMIVFLLIFPILFYKTNTNTIFDNKWVLISMIIPIFVSMFLTQSRNVYVALIICFVIFGLIYNWKYLIGFFIILTLVWFIVPQQYKSRTASIFDSGHQSNKTRLIMWDVGLKMIKDNPVTGVGEADKFEKVYELYKKIDPNNPSEGTHLHNNFLMVAVTYGIPAFLVFIGIFAFIFWKQIKYYQITHQKFQKLLILGCILNSIAFQVAGIFDYNYRDQKIIPLMIFTLAIPFVIMIIKNNNTEKELER